MRRFQWPPISYHFSLSNEDAQVRQVAESSESNLNYFAFWNAFSLPRNVSIAIISRVLLVMLNNKKAEKWERAIYANETP